MADHQHKQHRQLSPPADLETFGFPATPARVVLVQRPTSWRATRAILAVLISWGLMPAVVFVPPHVPWVIAAFLTGPILAYRRLTEHHTLRSVSGNCPRCQQALHEETRVRLKMPYTIACPGCRQDLVLSVRLDGREAA